MFVERRQRWWKVLAIERQAVSVASEKSGHEDVDD